MCKKGFLTPVGDYNNNRYGVEERARNKQALPFIEKQTAHAKPLHYRLNNNNQP